MLNQVFGSVYLKFKLHFYREVFRKWKDREVSLTTVETFCMEIIYALDHPSISEFAEFTSMSSANAADKINNLVRKGYLNRIQAEDDKRKFYLEPTQKYLDYYNISNNYMDATFERIKERFSPEELKTMEKILTVMDDELIDWN